MLLDHVFHYFHYFTVFSTVYLSVLSGKWQNSIGTEKMTPFFFLLASENHLFILPFHFSFPIKNYITYGHLSIMAFPYLSLDFSEDF